MGNLLVVGVRNGSLGHYVAEVASAQGWDVTTAGVSGEEKLQLDITNVGSAHAIMIGAGPWHSIVCTAGINLEGSILNDDMWEQLGRSLLVNTAGPLHLLQCWQAWWLSNLSPDHMYGDGAPEVPMHFVAVSSNSASIARSKSLAYCASKAALSMGIRCAARELADTWLNVWGVEPGWLSGTPMSMEVNARFEYGQPRTRIPGDRTVDPGALAHFIVGGLRNPYSSLNGCMIRMDGGEQ